MTTWNGWRICGEIAGVVMCAWLLGMVLMRNPQAAQEEAAQVLLHALASGTLQCSNSAVDARHGGESLAVLVIPHVPFGPIVDATGARNVVFQGWFIHAFSNPTLWLPAARIARNFVEVLEDGEYFYPVLNF